MSLESRLAAEELVASALVEYKGIFGESFREALISKITDAMDASWSQGVEDGKLEDRFHAARESLQKDLDSYNSGREEETDL